MRITIVLPMSISGGTFVLMTYARFLASWGHQVVLVSPPESSRWRRVASLFVHRSSESRVDGEGIERRTLERTRPVVDGDVPDADVVVATWWETAEWVKALSPSKGRKVHFIQGYEIYPWLPQERAHGVYRLPMQRIVISRWLAEIIESNYGDGSTMLVPNGVEHSEFFAAPRRKQARPTVGLLYSETPSKGFDASLGLLAKIRERLPSLRVLSFGFHAPARKLPRFVEFVENPQRHTLRDIYTQCDVWLTASSSEGFNMTASEAMACRTPVIAFRTGWPAHGITSGVNGACVAVGDFAALEIEVEKFLRLSEVDWERCSAAACDAVSGMSWELSARCFEAALCRSTARS